MEKTIGILGGMGPLATADLFRKITLLTDAARDNDHIRVYIDSNARIPDRTAAILGTAEEQEAVFRRLLADARLLEGAGCTVLAVPCNTSHFFLDRVQEHIGVPILNMIRETAAALKRQGRTRPGILATDGTIRSGLYQKEFAALGITAVTPSPAAQKLVMSLIYDDVKAGRDGDPQKFDAIHQDLLAQGCDSGVLACTELSVFAVRRQLPPFYTDAMSVLAERAVLACRRPLRDIFS